MFDEAYYALWAKHWAWGYLDHPPLIALWISLSTWLFGEGQFGVRALGTIAAAAGSGFVYLLSNDLFANRPAAAFAGLLYCATLLIGAGAIVITPETPLVFFWSIAVYALARIYRDGGAHRWWLVGTAMGLALQAKYTAVLLGAGIACALLVVPKMRLWWRRPQPYLAALLAFAIFSPVVVWNYQHGWASFHKQFGRATVHGLTLRYIAEFIGIQIGLLTPLVAVIAGAGLWLAFVRRRHADAEPETFLLSLIAPMDIYFLFHSLHARVDGNWTAPAYPILAILGAQAAFRRDALGKGLELTIAFCRRWAVPLGLAFISIVYAQAATAFIPLNPAKDRTAIMSGWSELAEKLQGIALREGAAFLLTSNYALTSELNFYAKDGVPATQITERIRWIAFAPPRTSLFAKAGLYVVEKKRDRPDLIAKRFGSVTRSGEVARMRGSAPIEGYLIYRVEKPIGAVLDPVE